MKGSLSTRRHWVTFALGCSLWLAGCAANSSDEEGPSETQAALTAWNGPLRVLLIGNSQLGYPPDEYQLKRGLHDLSVSVNSGTVPMTVRSILTPTDTTCNYPDPSIFTGDDQISNNDIVILQPPFTETGGSSCWDKFRSAAEAAHVEFGMLVTNTIWKISDTNPGTQNYTNQDDVHLDDAIRSYCLQHNSLHIPANKIMRQMLGSSPTPTGMQAWYQGDFQHPSALSAHVYVLSLYQAISWMTVANAPNDIPSLRCKEGTNPPCQPQYLNASQGTLIKSSVTQNVGNRLVALKANSNGKFVTAENGGSNPLVNRADVASTWETYRLSINNDGTVSMKATVNNQYVCAENGGMSSLIANRSALGSWEKFTLIRYGHFYALKSMANGNYVTFHQNGTTAAIAVATQIQDWEVFTVSYL